MKQKAILHLCLIIDVVTGLTTRLVNHLSSIPVCQITSLGTALVNGRKAVLKPCLGSGLEQASKLQQTQKRANVVQLRLRNAVFLPPSRLPHLRGVCVAGG